MDFSWTVRAWEGVRVVSRTSMTPKCEAMFYPGSANSIAFPRYVKSHLKRKCPVAEQIWVRELWWNKWTLFFIAYTKWKYFCLNNGMPDNTTVTLSALLFVSLLLVVLVQVWPLLSDRMLVLKEREYWYII